MQTNVVGTDAYATLKYEDLNRFWSGVYTDVNVTDVDPAGIIVSTPSVTTISENAYMSL